MNAKYQAKRCTRLVACLALAAWLTPVSSDDGNLSQQLRIQQQKSRFQLMLEQVQESARRRAAAADTAPATHARAPRPAVLGDWTQSMRLDPVSVTDPSSLDIDPEGMRRFRAQQAYERDQQRYLDYRQQRQALVAGSRSGSPVGFGGFSTKRRELVRYKTQSQQLSLQRKLRR